MLVILAQHTYRHEDHEIQSLPRWNGGRYRTVGPDSSPRFRIQTVLEYVKSECE